MEFGGICLHPILHHKEGVGIWFSLCRERELSLGDMLFSFLPAPKVRSNPPFPIISTASHSGKTGPWRHWPLGALIQKYKVCLFCWLVPARGPFWSPCELCQSNWHFSKLSQVNLNQFVSSKSMHKSVLLSTILLVPLCGFFILIHVSGPLSEFLLLYMWVFVS